MATTNTTVVAPLIKERTPGQMFRDEVFASFVLGIGLLAVMSAFGAMWSPGDAGVGFFIGQCLIGWFAFFHGGHANPDVTLAKAIRGSIFWSEAGVRWLGQAVGWSLVVIIGFWWFYGLKAIATGFGVVKPEASMPWALQFWVPFFMLFGFSLLAILVTEPHRHHWLTTQMQLRVQRASWFGMLILAGALGILVYLGAAFGTGINGMREIVPSFATLFAFGPLHAQFYWISLVGGRVGSLAAGVVGRLF